MSKLVNNQTVITKISKYKPIVVGMIQDTNIGMVIINDDIGNISNQLQFDNANDITYLIDRLNVLRIQMEVKDNGL